MQGGAKLRFTSYIKCSLLQLLGKSPYIVHLHDNKSITESPQVAIKIINF